MVMSYHLCWAQWIDKGYKGFVTNRIPGGIPFPELSWSTWFGWVGVEIFFVLSGFVIAYSGEGSTPFGFARSRMLRLYPAAWICASITAAASLSLNLGSPRELLRPWLASITLYPIKPWIDGSYWTLGIEISFYTVIFFLLALRRFHLLEAVTLIIGSVSSAYWILGALFADQFLFAHGSSTMLRLLLVRYGCFFAVGTLTYVISRRGISPTRLAAAT
jgi:peptidoglycan/LPS O-acetylase OafA/YrhL